MRIDKEALSTLLNKPADYISRYHNRSEVWQAAWDGEAYVWDLLPVRTREKVMPGLSDYEKREAVRAFLVERDELLRTVEAKKKNLVLADFLKINQAEIDILMQDSSLSLKEASGIARLAAWLRLANVKSVKAMFNNKQALFEALTNAVADEIEADLLPGPAFSSPAIFKRKVTSLKKEGVQALIDKRKQLKNRERFPAMWKAWLIDIYSKPEPKLLIPEIYFRYLQAHRTWINRQRLAIFPKIYAKDRVENGLRWHYNNPHYCNLQYINQDGEAVEIEPMSLESVRSFLRSDKVERAAAESRHGKKHYSDKYEPYMSLKKSPHSLMLVSADDYWLNFWLTINNTRTTKRPVVYIIWDEITGIPLGYAVGERQTKELVMEAVLDMLIFTGGYIPAEIELDNFGRSKKATPDDTRLSDMLKMLFKHVTYRKKARSKVAERFNYLGQDAYWRGKEGFLGGNVQDKKQDSKRNEDLSYYPEITFKMVKAEMEAFRKWKCNQVAPGSKATNLERFRASQYPNAQKLGKVQFAQLFGKSYLRTIRRGQVEIDTYGMHKEYWVDLDKLYQDAKAAPFLAKDGKVRIRTNPVGPNNPRPESEHFSEVYLFGVVNEENHFEDVFLGTLQEKPTVFRAKEAQDEGDKSILGSYHRALAESKEAQEAFKRQQDALVAAHFDEATLSNSWLASRWLDTTSKNVEERAQEQADSERLGNRFTAKNSSEDKTEKQNKNRLGKRF